MSSNIIPMRKLQETLKPTRKQKRTLLEAFLFKNIYQVRKEWELPNTMKADNIYEFMRDEYNAYVELEQKKRRNERRRQKSKENQIYVNKIMFNRYAYYRPPKKKNQPKSSLQLRLDKTISDIFKSKSSF